MLLDFFARIHSPNLHARGIAGTRFLLKALAPQPPGARILELGFGTGHTMVLAASVFPGAQLFGIEKSAGMHNIAKMRFRFCGLKSGKLDMLSGKLPFPDQFLDAIYCESVLAIVPDDELPGLLLELNRVLRQGGKFVCNESVWLEGLPVETIRSINAQCLQAFGIVQASERYPYPQHWRRLFESTGFQVASMHSLSTIPPGNRLPWNGARVLSMLFSRLGWLKGQLLPALRQKNRAWREKERNFSSYGRYLEGWFFVLNKP